MDSFLLDELNFCKFQVSTYTAMYEKLLAKYLNIEKPSANTVSDVFRGRSRRTNKLDESQFVENSVENHAENGDLAASIMNFICKSETSDTSGGPTRRAEEAGKSTEENGKSIDVVRQTPNSMNNPSTTYDNAVTNRKLIRESAKNEDNDMKSIDNRRLLARTGLLSHNSKLADIHAEEQRLLAMGMDPQLVYKRVREKYYPEAIPASERKVPSIMVETRDENGKLLRKKVNLLAFDEKSDSESDRCLDSPFMDSPTMENSAQTAEEEKVAEVAEEMEDAEDDIVDEQPI